MSDPSDVYALAYSEGIRALDRQAATLDQVRLRASSVLTTATVASVFLVGIVADASRPERDPAYWVLTVVGALLYTALLCLVVSVQLPRFEWRFYLWPRAIIEAYADPTPSVPPSRSHRALALHVDRDLRCNQRNLGRMHRLLAGALVLLVLEIATWAILVAKTA